jgi:atypical dual specificity phosphatase
MPGKLAGSAMPGGTMYAVDAYAGADLQELRSHGVSTVCSLAPVVEGFAGLCERNGLRWLYYPIEDFGVPRDIRAFERVIQEAVEHIRADEAVCVHCRAGIGRTGIGLACIVGRYLGLDGEAALKTVRRRRSGVETDIQSAFIYQFLANEA